jgi:YD repeat-containing protein
VRRWETSWSEDRSQKIERELAADVLAARRVYDAAGRLLQEEQYRGGALTQKSVFTYTGNKLRRMRVLDADGKVTATEEYDYLTNGSLREVRRTDASGGGMLSSFTFGSGGLAEERNTIGDTLFIARYDARGRVTSREQRKGGDRVLREDFTYRPDTDTLLSSRENAPPEGRVTDRRYDDAGRLIGETTSVRGVDAEVISYVHDDQGRVTAKTRRSPAGQETWRYTVAASGSVTREEYYRRGSLEKVTSYGEGKLRTEELYRDGDLFMKVSYDGDTRLREEVYVDGTLVRQRSFP